MGILIWIVLGALAGWIASMIVRSQQGLLLDIITGIVGALIGGWVMSLFGYGGVSGFNVYSIVVAIIGSVILLVIVKAIRRTA
ncbi:MAG TPA: GlsB/YeaQ/YmgE family stress response membrane protein [Candidatus Paceibacterota bacterium]|jgi:uncharacterized membrane protein YeaQ/YmgE (transglycosylase-associated protein family)|nr:GlsB/YeaQ/YmgE family stress response membrane protein [Candidatus Paceibacterota bacterium]